MSCETRMAWLAASKHESAHTDDNSGKDFYGIDQSHEDGSHLIDYFDRDFLDKLSEHMDEKNSLVSGKPADQQTMFTEQEQETVIMAAASITSVDQALLNLQVALGFESDTNKRKYQEMENMCGQFKAELHECKITMDSWAQEREKSQKLIDANNALIQQQQQKIAELEYYKKKWEDMNALFAGEAK